MAGNAILRAIVRLFAFEKYSLLPLIADPYSIVLFRNKYPADWDLGQGHRVKDLNETNENGG